MFEATALASVRQQVCALTAAFDPAAVSAVDAAGVVAEAATIEHAAAALKAMAAARVADSSVWRFGGHRDGADWLAAKTGTSPTRAAEQIATGRRLADGQLAATGAAARRGALSPEQAAAISDAATADPAAEGRLLAQARVGSLRELRDVCARTKAAADPNPDATHERIRKARRLRFFPDAEGGANLSGRTVNDEMAIVRRAVDAVVDDLFDQARTEGRREPRDAYAMDALVRICRASLNVGVDTGTDDEADEPEDTEVEPVAPDAGDPTEADEPGGDEPSDVTPVVAARRVKKPARVRSKKRRRLPPQWLGLLRVDVDALRRGAVEGEELCEIAGVGPVPVRVARELLGDAALKLVITKGVDVANITHLGRSPTVAQRLALAWLSPCCVVAGCTAPRIQYDHRRDWTITHHTRLDELDGMCGHHHDLKTHHHWALTTPDHPGGPRHLVAPDDPRHPNHPNHRAATAGDPEAHAPAARDPAA